MTREQIKSKVDTLCKKHNEEVIKDNPNYTKLGDIERESDELITKDAALAEEEFLSALPKQQPLLAAIKQPEYTILKIKVTLNKETSIKTWEVTNATRRITLQKLFQKFPTSFRYKQWLGYVEQFNYRLLLKVADDLNLSPKTRSEIESKFEMKNGGREIALGGTPTSQTQMMKQLRKVCIGIMGDMDEKAIETLIRKEDLNALLCAYTSMGRGLATIKTLNTSKLADALLTVMNRAITGKEWNLEYKAGKESGATPVKDVEPENQNPESKPAESKEAESKEAEKPAK